jgi:AraC-like DNA-binding protein
MEACVAKSGEHYFPFALGETFAFEYLTDLETFITTSSTLREASRVFTWLREFVNPLMDVRLEESGDTASLTLADPPDIGPLKHYYSESMFAGITKFARVLMGERAASARICFRHPRPDREIDYEGFFRLPVQFGCARNEILLPRKFLDMPLAGGFPALHRQAEFRIEQKRAQPAARGTISSAVLETLAAQPALLGRGIERGAAALGLHARTLQRRLQEEGTSFFELQDRARHEEAVRALKQGVTDLEALSERLGFSDRRSFTRAFKRWTGLSPSRFRKPTGPAKPA